MFKKAIILVILVLVVLSVAAVAGCGSSQQKEKETLSTDLQQMKTDLGQLLNAKTYNSFDSFEQAWKKIQTQYDKTSTAAQQVKDVQWADVKSAYDDFSKAVKAVSSSQSLQQNISSVLIAGQEFIAALDALNKSVLPSK